MFKKFSIQMPKALKKLKYGFSIQEKSYIIVDKALTKEEIEIKYPDAVSIIEI